MQTEPTFREQGLSALRQGDAAAAARFLSEAVRADGSDAECWSALGIALCTLGRTAEGVAALRRAVALRPDAAPLQYNVGRALEQQGLLAEALQYYRRAQELDPGHAGAAAGVTRVSSATAGGTPPSLGEFLLAPAAPPPSAPSAASPPPVTPFRPGPAVPATAIPSAPPPPAPVSYPAPAGFQPAYSVPYAATPAPARRRGPSPWAVIAAIVGSLVIVSGGLVVLLVALLLPAAQRAREAARRVERRQQQNAWRTTPGFSPAPQYAPSFDRSRRPSLPRYQPPAPRSIPQTRIVIPQPRRIKIPEPPRFSPPPVPEPPRFDPPAMPSARMRRMMAPPPFPTAPTFRYRPQGKEAPG
jgi:hypothetical protein